MSLVVGCTAPLWRRQEGAWLLAVSGRRGHTFSANPRWSLGGDGGRRHRVPALAALDPADPRTLPDGSRWVDAAALALVCRAQVWASRTAGSAAGRGWHTTTTARQTACPARGARRGCPVALAEIERLREERDGLRARILGLAEAYEEVARELRGRPDGAARAGDAEDTAERIRRCL